MSLPANPDPQMGLHTLIIAYCGQRHVIGQWIDTTGPMYPLDCWTCRTSYPSRNYPIFIGAEAVQGFHTPDGAFVVAPPGNVPLTDGQLGGG